MFPHVSALTLFCYMLCLTVKVPRRTDNVERLATVRTLFCSAVLLPSLRIAAVCFPCSTLHCTQTTEDNVVTQPEQRPDDTHTHTQRKIFSVFQKERHFSLNMLPTMHLLWNPETTASIHSSFLPFMHQISGPAWTQWQAQGWTHWFLARSALTGCFFSMETRASVNWDLVNDLIG